MTGELPIVQGNKPHLLLIADLERLFGLGADTNGETLRARRLRWTGALDPRRAPQLALAAKLTVVLTMGPWRVVNIGRTMRTLPPWLRGMLELVHRHCRGPDCDRPAVWTEAHHEHPWDAGGETDLNATIPLCQSSRHGVIRTTQPQQPEPAALQEQVDMLGHHARAAARQGSDSVDRMARLCCFFRGVMPQHSKWRRLASHPQERILAGSMHHHFRTGPVGAFFVV